jgi:hypothetical protein
MAVLSLVGMSTIARSSTTTTTAAFFYSQAFLPKPVQRPVPRQVGPSSWSLAASFLPEAEPEFAPVGRPLVEQPAPLPLPTTPLAPSWATITATRSSSSSLFAPTAALEATDSASCSSPVNERANDNNNNNSPNDDDNNNNNNDAERSWELKVGKVLDTLRHDYPYLLTESPDFSIYHRNVEVVDPSGVTVHGLSTYKTSFRLLHALVKFLYCPQRSGLTFRMCYDKARRNIRIHWNAHVVPREIFGGGAVGWTQDLYVDGISVYELDPKSGLVVQHRMEQLLFNNMPVRPKEGVIAALQYHHTTVTVPSFSKQQRIVTDDLLPSLDQWMPNTVLEFASPLVMSRPRLQLPGSGGASVAASSLFALEASGGDPSEAAAAASSSKGSPSSSSSSSSSSSKQKSQYPDLDWTALENKNKSRKKFGLQPLTPEEFLELESQIQQMAQAHQAQHKAAMQSAAEMSQKKQPPKLNNFLNKLFGALQDTCETNFDCERPEICCDFGFKKMCCASGTPVIDGIYGRSYQPALVPVPVENYPPGQGPNGDLDPRNYNRKW